MNQRICPACEYPVAIEDESCPNCGTWIGQVEPESIKSNKPGTSESDEPEYLIPFETFEASPGLNEPGEQQEPDDLNATTEEIINMDDKKRCPHCDGFHPPKAKFCPVIGKPIVPSDSPIPQNPPWWRHWGIWPGVVGVVVLFMVLLIGSPLAEPTIGVKTSMAKIRSANNIADHSKTTIMLTNTVQFIVTTKPTITDTIMPTNTKEATATLAPTSTPVPISPSASITYPRNGGTVGWKIDVRGEIHGLKPGWRAFMCIQSTVFGELIWPQGEIFPDSSGNWVVLGVYQSVGYDYKSFVVITNNDNSAEMLADQYYRAGGMNTLPVDTTIISPIIVVTRK